MQTARVVHSFVDGEGLVCLWTIWSKARFLPSHFQSKPVGTVPSGLAGVACCQTGQSITGQGVQPTSLGHLYSPCLLAGLAQFPDFAAGLRFLSDLTSTMRNLQVFALSEKDIEFIPRNEDFLERCWENRMSLHKLWERFHFG